MPPAPTTSAQALGNYQQFAGSMQSPDQAYAGAEQSLGVPQQQQQVSGLRQAVTNTTNLLNNVAPSVMGRTAGSLVTSAQATRQIGNEQAPIAANLKDQSGKEVQAEGDLSSLLGRAGTMANLKVQGDSNKLASLKSIYDSMFGKEQADAAQKLEQQKLAEMIRSNHANEALNSAKSNALSPSEQKSLYDLGTQQQLSQAFQSMAAQLKSVTGNRGGTQRGDNYVSPQSYGKAKTAWLQAGLDPSKFDVYFSGFRNPTNKFYPVDKSPVSSLTNAGY